MPFTELRARKVQMKGISMAEMWRPMGHAQLSRGQSSIQDTESEIFGTDLIPGGDASCLVRTCYGVPHERTERAEP